MSLSCSVLGWGELLNDQLIAVSRLIGPFALLHPVSSDRDLGSSAKAAESQLFPDWWVQGLECQERLAG